MKRNYFSVHNHTEYSNLKIIDSINRADRMIDYTYDLGLSGLVFTDHDCLSGHLKFIRAYKNKLVKEWQKLHPNQDPPSIEEISNELDFKVGLGNEIYLSEEGLTENGMSEPGTYHFWHLILLAKDAEGYNQLRQLSSAAWKRAWFRTILRTPTYPSDLFEYVKGGHLICSTACLGGYAAWRWKNYIETNNEEHLAKLDNHLAMLEELFGKSNFFIELQPNEEDSEQNQYNQFMITRYWHKYPFIFSTDSHYLKADEREIHKAFLNSKTSKEREVDSFYKYAYIMSQDEVRNLMPYVTNDQFQTMVQNTQLIKTMIKFFDLERPKIIAEVPYEHYDEYQEDLEIFSDVDEETYPNFYYYLHTDNKADHYLAELVAHGFIEHYQLNWNTNIYYKRLEEEFWTIKTVGDKIQQSMSNYFITMAKMVQLMWEAGSLVGPARGSAGAMLINFLTGITQMNPISLNLPFVWRFMHPSRPDFPDIDVDSESDKRTAVFNKVRDYFRANGGDVINVCTFGTEGTKSALKTAGRGLKIDDDIINYLTSMIPNERGFDWSLKDCYYGNDDDRKPIKAFKEQMDQYPKLWELAQNIEGLVTRLGVHASGVIAINGDFTDHGSYLKTSKEQLVTAFDLHDQEDCGLIKYDMLTVSALDRIHQCMNYLLEDKQIEWQGSLYDTYMKYLSPQNINYTDEKMWNMVGNGEISSLFQFDTLVGGQAIQSIKPRSLSELAIANSIMRLMAEGEQPIDIYVKQKRCPEIWYDDMRNNGLTMEEIKVIEKYLKPKNGVADSQEVVMQLSMDPKISGFDMKDANKLRKVIAKKKFSEIEALHKYYIECGEKLGNRKEILNYVWDKQFKLSFGYSFSTIHTTAYSLIALQEMNLARFYPIIYWNCACLSVDSSAIADSDFYNLIDDDIVDIDDNENKKIQNKMDYAKLASALDKFRNISKINLPDINESRLSFTPNVQENTILYGLKGISKITDPTINEIMNNRPFTSLKDFRDKTTTKVVTKDKIVNLIKCGAFDAIEHKTRAEIAKEFIWSVCDAKKKLTLQNANMLIDQDLFPTELEYQCNVYKLTKQLRTQRDPDKLWYCGDRLCIPEGKFDLWKKIITDSKIIPQDLIIAGEPRRVIDSKAWDTFYEMNMIYLRNYIKANHDVMLQQLNTNLFNAEYNKYFSGDENQWELDSLNFYFHEHPLSKVIPQMNLDIVKVNQIEEGAQDGMFYIKGKEIPKMKLFTIAGTVIDKDKVKGLVTLQCPSGVINLKLYKDLYATFVAVNEEISQDSFFEKGTHLLVTGIQRGATFVPKVYKNTGRKSILKINLDTAGNFKNFEEKGDI